MRRAIYPGSFDPITNGHLDILSRALRIFDEVVLAVARNENKAPLFTQEERVALNLAAIRDLPGHERVKVGCFHGLLVDYALTEQAATIIRGLRAVSDFEFELQLALMNRKLRSDIDTIFLMPKDNYTYLSSSLVKEIARLGGDVADFVPPCVQQALQTKLRQPRP
ncbi:MAG: pantetheine-phosphate adenylyltransferase [Verrucomicrobiales bacterium]|jgi:pantetheine-phosphate adenylyltransferase|nr:pantetheine-phosphate adenylyltransferase [Verrucomicrobiales bacterium]